MYMALVNDIRIALVSYLPLPPLHVTNGMSSLVMMPLNCFFTLSGRQQQHGQGQRQRQWRRRRQRQRKRQRWNRGRQGKQKSGVGSSSGISKKY